jgi:hypothetical protein
MEFNKNELHILKFIRTYQIISIGCMIFGIIGILSGLYNYFSSPKPYDNIYLNNQLIGISISVLGMGYLMHNFTKFIEKLGRFLN